MLFFSEIMICRHGKQYKCAIFGKKVNCNGKDHQQKVSVEFFRSKLILKNKISLINSNQFV